MGSPIRTLVFAGIITLSFLWAYIGFIGSYQLNNNIPLNATLKAQYEAVAGNVSSGIFQTTGNLSAQAQNQGGQLGGIASLNSIGMGAQFLTSIPAIYTAVSQLTIGSLGNTLGISLNPFETNIALLIIIIIVIAILSAIFLFPI
jgi:hypothetical protein